MEDRNHSVQHDNDYFIIDGVRYHIEQLKSLPVGDRLMDSRTLFKQGMVAFQSTLSPLSNLFPCRLHYDGKTFTSLEHAYQFTKAIHHNLPATANDIKYDPDPHQAMNQGNQITENQEWAACKLGLMEQLVRHKYEQVPIFSDTLKRSYSYRLVENTWSHFWGSNCPFNSNAIWTRSYKGLNHMGRILERIRDSY